MKENNTIGIQEKKELSKIIEAEYQDIIKTMQQEIEFTEGEILEEAQGKFGIKVINQEITNLKQKIDLLEGKKREIGFGSSSDGFSTFYNRDTCKSEVDPNTKAGKFFFLKMSRHTDIRALKAQKSERMKNLWLKNDRTEVTTLVTQKIDVPMIEHKKKK